MQHLYSSKYKLVTVFRAVKERALAGISPFAVYLLELTHTNKHED